MGSSGGRAQRADRRRLGSMASGGGRGNRQGGGGGGGGGGFSGFGNFPDPFANFGMGMGGGGSRGRSIFDVFDNDPFFNDPFFTRPFGSMFGGQGGGLFGGPQGFIGGSVFDNQAAPRAPRAPAAYLEDRPRSPPQFHHQRDPIIEELADSDSDVDAEPQSRQGQQPIIEHPDDDVRPEPQERPRPFPSSVVQAGPLPAVNNNGGRSYSFQSSSVSYGGPNGTYYASSAARRMGPNGVIEEEFQEKDSTSGHELKRVSRGLGVKGRSITRKRTSEGREQTLETLHNLQEDEVPTFERTWEDRSKSLPQWNRNRPHTIGAPHGNPDFLGSGSRSRVALPGSSSSQGGRQQNQK
ncbi:hypothetical protein KC19_1G010300 [Ceratodon purpureus]|uniref:Glycine-rich protein n=1 Tax=Ceratodon purpureus TaxID=3225 RepID=A0A8T0J344_CERPU|nr:hypothetical protein KC19_1G010300 [Ceratodon purpureus]